MLNSLQNVISVIISLCGTETFNVIVQISCFISRVKQLCNIQLQLFIVIILLLSTKMVDIGGNTVQGLKILTYMVPLNFMTKPHISDSRFKQYRGTIYYSGLTH